MVAERVEPDAAQALRRYSLLGRNRRRHHKAICSQFSWDSQRPAIETAREYAAFEYSPDVADDVVKVVEMCEQNHLRTETGPSAEKAWVLVQGIDLKLTPHVRDCWRWRLVCLRALIDAELLKTHEKLEGKVLQAAFRELTKMNHAEQSHSMPIRPPRISDADGNLLSRSACEPDHHG